MRRSMAARFTLTCPPSRRADISFCRSVLSIRNAVVSIACSVMSIVSSKMTSCENIASSPMTTTLMTVTKLATHSVNCLVNDVRTF